MVIYTHSAGLVLVQLLKGIHVLLHLAKHITKDHSALIYCANIFFQMLNQQNVLHSANVEVECAMLFVIIFIDVNHLSISKIRNKSQPY